MPQLSKLYAIAKWWWKYERLVFWYHLKWLYHSNEGGYYDVWYDEIIREWDRECFKVGKNYVRSSK